MLFTVLYNSLSVQCQSYRDMQTSLYCSYLRVVVGLKPGAVINNNYSAASYKHCSTSTENNMHFRESNPVKNIRDSSSEH